MGLNDTPSGERTHIGFFGCRNAGKSSLVNAVTNQELSVVSNVAGTTTDPVQKAMELLPLGPVMIIDTPGYDDFGELGEKRVEKTKRILNRCDAAVLVTDSTRALNETENELLSLFKEKEIPYLIAKNKSDLLESECKEENGVIYVSAKEKSNINEFKEALAGICKNSNPSRLIGDLVCENDLVVLVIPIDSAAPKGRIILPQQQVLRDLLDSNACAICVQTEQLPEVIDKFKDRIKAVVTDSQAFSSVMKIVPESIYLTSFSVLMARSKGFLEDAVAGVRSIENLKDGDVVLISEGCTHHRQCEDIGTVKIPKWLKEHTKKNLIIETSSGRDFPQDLSKYALVIHCGGCMLNSREIRFRMNCAKDSGVCFTNYGTAIAYMNGILNRSIKIIEDNKNKK